MFRTINKPVQNTLHFTYAIDPTSSVTSYRQQTVKPYISLERCNSISYGVLNAVSVTSTLTEGDYLQLEFNEWHQKFISFFITKLLSGFSRREYTTGKLCAGIVGNAIILTSVVEEITDENSRMTEN